MAVAAILFQLSALHAGNVLSLQRSSDNAIIVALSNDGPIAGIQFSVNARGGIQLRPFSGMDRLNAAGIGVYQFLANDSTLNVVLLAPPYAALSAGSGPIGTVQFGEAPVPTSDSMRVFLSGIVLCDANARELSVTASVLAWGNGSANVAAIEQNYPNPFNPSTTISYRLGKPSHVRLAVYDVTGREIQVLVDQYQDVGRHSVQWNAERSTKGTLSSGMYFAYLTAGGNSVVSKMVLAK